MSTFAERRPTRDNDLQALGIANDTASLTEITAQVVSIDHVDGINFASITAATC